MKKKKKTSGQPKRSAHKPTKNAGFARSRFFHFAAIGLIVVLGAMIYSNSLDCSFHLDDGRSIVDNKSIRDVSDIGRIFNSGPTRFTTYYTFALNYHFGQLEVSGYHYVNILIHLINACLIYWLTLLIFSTAAMRDAKLASHKQWISLFTALMFVAHPLATQSVTYIVQRIASLVTLFYLLSIVMYVKARILKNGGAWRYALFAIAALSAVLAMLTKENAFTLPFAILLVEVCFLQNGKLRINFRDYRVIGVLAALVGVLLIIPLNNSFSIFDPIPPELGNTYTVTPVNYFLTQFSAIVKYIQLLILPVGLNLDYDFPIANSLFELRTIGSLVLLLGILALGVFAFKKNRLIAFGIFWFFLTLAVESGIIPISDLIFEHRTYLPSVGFFLVATTGVFSLLSTRSLALTTGTLSIVVVVYSLLAHQRNEVWKDDLTLWSDVIEKSPGKARPYGTRGDYYLDQQQYDKALEDFTKAIENNPNYEIALHNRASVYRKIGNDEAALTDFTKAIEIDSNYILAYYNRANAYFNLSRWNEALADYTKAIELNPRFEQAYYGRSLAHTKHAAWDQAIEDCSQAITLNPQSASAYFNRGYSYYKKGDYQQAIQDYNEALGITPTNANIFLNRGIAHEYLNELEQALADYTKALELNPNLKSAATNRDNLQRRLGQN